MPPWNDLQVLEPTPLPNLSDPDRPPKVAPEDVPVAQRVRPEYQAPGIRSGAWLFSPTLTAGTFYDSNVFSSESNRQSDIAGLLGVDLRGHNSSEKDALAFRLNAQQTTYRQHSGLNETDASFKGTGRFELHHDFELLTALEAAYLHEGVGTLSSPTGAVEPTPYSLFSGDVTLRRQSGRTTTAFGVRADSYNFGSPHAADGSIINQDARDGQVYTAHGRFDYAFSDKLGWFTAVEGNRRDLRGSPDRPLSSDGYRALTGFDVEFTHLIKGEIAGGYMAQHFTSSAIGNIEGPAYRAMLTWSPTRRFDVHFNAEQVVTESSDTSSTGVRADALQLGFDYEFRPNVILSSAATYEKDRFFGVDRSDNVYFVDTRLKYLLNKFGTISIWHRYLLRDSSSPGVSFDKHQVGIDASARF
ncbi:MAG TPA: outer membrane beta-barrel protein [Pseudolabrys sp.]|nr:outer membrane beta-barrel protein [Pseudolabrys sp.]